jgi:hypothetical protein
MNQAAGAAGKVVIYLPIYLQVNVTVSAKEIPVASENHGSGAMWVKSFCLSHQMLL